MNQRNSIARERENRTNKQFDRLREMRFYARALPLRVEQTTKQIEGVLTTKRRGFGDRYFRSSVLILVLIIVVSSSFTPYRQFYVGNSARPGILLLVSQKLKYTRRCRRARTSSSRTGTSTRNGSAGLRFVSRKKRTYVTHYPCCGPCSKL